MVVTHLLSRLSIYNLSNKIKKDYLFLQKLELNKYNSYWFRNENDLLTGLEKKAMENTI
jgi:hypothetical protein